MEIFNVTTSLKIALAVLYAILVLMSVIGYGLKFAGKHVDNFIIRMRSFWIIILLFTGAFIFCKEISFLFIMFLCYLALKEFFSIMPTHRNNREIMLWAYLAIPVQFYFLYIDWYVMFYLFIPLYMFLLIPVRMIFKGEVEGFIKSCSIVHWGLMSTVYSLGYVLMFFAIPASINPKGGVLGLLFYILVITIANDFTQFFFGKLFGKHKIVPTISPNKTWEGFIGGIFGTTVLSVIMGYFLTPLSIVQSVIIGIILAIAGFLGDVTMSAIKRDLGIKDTSQLIPGHGGILDRFDSLIFTAPIFFHYIAYTFNISILR